MANITITVQSLLNTAVYNSYTIDNGQTVNQLKTAINTARGFDSTWYDIVLNESVVSGTDTLSSLGIVTGTRLRTHNKISRLATKELKQKAKLDLAALDRVAAGETRATYDLSELPTQYNDNTIVNNPNSGGLIEGRPWISTVSAFTFYESFGTTTALSTTQYVSGNKIYAYSSTYDVPGFQAARVVVNDIEVLLQGDTPLPYGRGHNLVVLNSYGDVVTAAAQYDTYINPANLTTLASALNAVATGNIVVLVVYDASALNAAVRSAINTGYGSTNSTTWTADRKSHIFIGIKA
ncbi:Interleukin-like EMT inducer [uncultured Caudovirales phage]|uniref:Interleukin-like EMT inducer n=1 Tax=uncultured Caudovirales phage TaxID=2100421 RepID=A0A6J7WM86_9CAUD|nr:Interleukin-like EMT inducer [uncultured Caudovirales phage]